MNKADTERLDWLENKQVEVRGGNNLGREFLVWPGCGISVRNAIDKALSDAHEASEADSVPDGTEKHAETQGSSKSNSDTSTHI